MDNEPIYCYIWTNTYGGRLALTQQEWIDFNQSEFHRVGEPAVIWVDGARQWWVDGKPHRLDGPAFEWPDGHNEWAIDGLDVPGDEIEAWIEENDVDISTEEGQMALKLRWL